MNYKDIVEKDKKYIWHPFTLQIKNQAKKIEDQQTIPIVRGEKEYLISEDGRRIFDGISSWWVNLHGHAHPYIAEKVSAQLSVLEHVLFAGFTHPGAVALAERLMKLCPPGFCKVFFSDNGSTSVEVALKMAIQYWYHQGKPRKKFVAFKGGYHGDTFGAMSVGERSPFNRPFWPFLFDVLYIDPPVKDKVSSSLEQMRAILRQEGEEIAAFIFEPLVQGTAGMVIQEKEGLNQLLKMAKEYGVLTIADEVMTGFGRTGKTFAMDHIEEDSDLICVAKGLTGGALPLGATLCHERIYDAFLADEHDKARTFFHGHSYTANPLAVAAGLASLDLLESEECQKQIQLLQKLHQSFQYELLMDSSLKEKIMDIRTEGTILALELNWGKEKTGYFHPLRDSLYNYFLQQDLLLRPLGNVIYVLPPYCTEEGILQKTYQAIKELLISLPS